MEKIKNFINKNKKALAIGGAIIGAVAVGVVVYKYTPIGAAIGGKALLGDVETIGETVETIADQIV
jgi:hypothetical protein